MTESIEGIRALAEKMRTTEEISSKTAGREKDTRFHALLLSVAALAGTAAFLLDCEADRRE